MVKKALLIGINYEKTDFELHGCINDVKNISEILKDSYDIHILTDETEIIPTKQNIIKEIEWLTSNLKKGDTLFFYYSGHGSNSKDVSKDESDKKDEDIVPLDVDNKGIGVIKDDWLYTNLAKKIPEDVTLWTFFDSCNSGTVLDLTYCCNSQSKLKKGKLKNITKYIADDWSTKFSFYEEKSSPLLGNVFQFSGCTDKQFSEDASINKIDQGAFSYCLQQFLKNHSVKTEDGKIKFESGQIKLKDMLKEINCLLDINKFRDQDSQLSVGKLADLEKTFDI
jgi:hypothetical protein